MSVPIIENWSRISAEIVKIETSAEISEFSEVEMKVQKVDPVQDYPNLLAEAAGSSLVVHFPSDLVESEQLESGSRISCWVRKAGVSRCFVHREHVRRLGSGGNSGHYQAM